MSDYSALEQFLHTDPRDVGCEKAMDLLHVYVELLLDEENARAEKGAAERRFPGVVVHLLACGPCGEDFNGLLAAAGGSLA
jgi:hypothetical protein